MADIECDICFRSFNGNERKPRNLPCGHMSCSSCIDENISRGFVYCSTCRSPHHANAASGLPVNFYVMKLVDQPTKPEKPKETADDFNGGLCPEHKSSHLYFVCRTHNKEICRECTVINHNPNNCDIISFKDQMEEKRSTMQNEIDAEINSITESISYLNDYERGKDNDVKFKSGEIKRLLKEVDEDRKAGNEAKKAKIESTNIKKTLESASEKLKDAAKKVEIKESCSIVRNKVRSSQIWTEELMKNFDYKLSESLFIKNPTGFLRMFHNSRQQVFIVHQVGSIQRSAELTMKDGMIILNSLHINVKPTQHAVTIKNMQLTLKQQDVYASQNMIMSEDEINPNQERWQQTSSNSNMERRDRRYRSKKNYHITDKGHTMSHKIQDSLAFGMTPKINLSKVFITFSSETVNHNRKQMALQNRAQSISNTVSSKQVIGTVYISIDTQAPQAEQFLTLFTGIQGYSYKGSTSMQVLRDNVNSSYAILWTNCNQENGNATNARLFSQNRNINNTVEKGNICVYGNCGFMIFHENPPTNQNYEVVGSVVSGLATISKVADMLTENTSQAHNLYMHNSHPLSQFARQKGIHQNQVNVSIDEVGVVIQSE